MFRFQKGLKAQALELTTSDFRLSPDDLFHFETRNCHGILAKVSSISQAVQGRESEFLPPHEFQRWQKFRAENYRKSWLSGRICSALLCFTTVESVKSIEKTEFLWSEIEVKSRDSEGKGQPPELYYQGEKITRSLTISHTDETILVVIAKTDWLRLGCDLVPLNSITTPMKNRYFRESEYSVLSDNLPSNLTNRHKPGHDLHDQALLERIWAVKETAYKTLNQDRPFRPSEWLVENINGKIFRGIETTSRLGSSLLVHTHKHKNQIVALGEIETETPQSRP